jgi:hypothetical protein
VEIERGLAAFQDRVLQRRAAILTSHGGLGGWRAITMAANAVP